MQFEGAINDKKKTGRPSSSLPARKNHLKRLTNKVRDSQFGHLYKQMPNVLQASPIENF